MGRHTLLLETEQQLPPNENHPALAWAAESPVLSDSPIRLARFYRASLNQDFRLISTPSRGTFFGFICRNNMKFLGREPKCQIAVKLAQSGRLLSDERGDTAFGIGMAEGCTDQMVCDEYCSVTWSIACF